MDRDNKKSGSGWRNSLAEIFDLPKEIILDLPRITVVGNLQVYIENHRGIIQYTDEKVRIAINNGELIVRGEGLQIRNLFSEEIFVDGVIVGIDYDV